MNKISGRWKKLEGLVTWGITVGMFTVSIFLSRVKKLPLITDIKFAELTTSSVNQLSVTLLVVLSWVLLGVTIMMAFQWIKAVRNGLQILKDYLEEFIPKTIDFFYLTTGLAIAIAIFCIFSNVIVIYSMIFISYKIFEVYGIRKRDSRFIRPILEHARKKALKNDKRRKKWVIIENYYFKNPQDSLAIINTFASFIPLILALLARTLFTSEPITATLFLIIAYGIMIGIIICNEVIHAIWRYRRNNKL